MKTRTTINFEESVIFWRTFEDWDVLFWLIPVIIKFIYRITGFFCLFFNERRWISLIFTFHIGSPMTGAVIRIHYGDSAFVVTRIIRIMTFSRSLWIHFKQKFHVELNSKISIHSTAYDERFRVNWCYFAFTVFCLLILWLCIFIK